jgi:hypothetical protein
VRDEDELRAAFQQKAAEAPRTADVMRAVRAREAAPPARRRHWLMPAVAGATAIAIGVPLAIALSHSSSSEKKSAGAASGETAAAGARGAESSRAGAGAPNAPEATAAHICSRADVTVSLQGDTLRIRSGGVACRIARVPSVQAGATPGTTAAAPAPEFGTLLPHTTATAALRWNGSCATRTSGVIRIDWGAGPVEVHASGVPEAACGAATVGPLHGLH